MYRNPFYWKGGIVRVNLEPGDWYEMEALKPIVGIKQFDNHAVHVLIPRNNKSGKPYLKKIGDKFQDKNELILRNALIYARWNKILDMMDKPEPLIFVKLDDGTWIHCEPHILFEDNNITAPFQHGEGGV